MFKLPSIYTRASLAYYTGILLSLVGILFYITVIVSAWPGMYSMAYWALLNSFWSVPLSIKYSQLRTNQGVFPVKENIFSSTTAFSIVCVLSSLVTMFASIAARHYDRPVSIFALTTAVTASCFAYLHFSIEKSYIRESKYIYVPVSIVKFLFGLLFAGLHLTACYQSIGLATESQFQNGKSVYLKDSYHDLNLVCGGEKRNQSDPLIWFEHGLGGSNLDFYWIQQNVSSYARWCAYDHAGLGWSDIPVNYPRTTEQIVQELQSLLISANITDDLYVVGHSMAGYNMRVAQRLINTNKIVGITLVDPVDTTWPGCEEGAQGSVDLLVILINTSSHLLLT